MRVAITGSSGLIGRALRAVLGRGGHEVTRVVRGAPRQGATGSFVRWDPAAGRIDGPGLEGHDAVVHLAGESLLGVWTAGKKRAIRESRVKGTALLSRTLAGLSRPPRVLVSSSAVGYYGARDPAEPVTEDAAPGSGFLAETAIAWEAATTPAAEAGIRVVLVRTALVLSPDGGPLPLMLPVFKLGLGGPLGSGDQPWPWIALEDVVQVILFAIQTETLSGPVNLAAPEAVTNAGFTRALGEALSRPTFLTVPSFLMRLAPGAMADEMLLTGARVVPARLQDAGYAFRQPALLPALRSMVD